MPKSKGQVPLKLAANFFLISVEEEWGGICELSFSLGKKSAEGCKRRPKNKVYYLDSGKQ